MSLAVKRYADALLDVCFEEKCQDEVYAQFKLLYEQMKADKEKDLKEKTLALCGARNI